MATEHHKRNDSELASMLEAGDVLAYREIYHRYAGVLYRHAYAKLHDREEARDMVHEVFESIWAMHHQITYHNNLAGYLYRTLQNKTLNLIARRQRLTNYIDSLQEFLDQGEAATDYLVRHRELTEIIEKEIAGLPEKMRHVFELSRKQYFTHRQIADQLELSEKTVKNHINSALKIMRIKFAALFSFLIVALSFFVNILVK